ncbi:conserved hypothetical protein [Bacillus sp. 349Y]|nr:conserved hypothetical protein [Bacillus sp. 349Y]
MDMLMEIYNKLRADTYIAEKVGTRINFYEYPNTTTMSGPIVVIEEVMPATPGVHGDNEAITDDHFIHIEVWVKGNGGRTIRDEIARKIQAVMRKEFGMGLDSAMKPEYDKDLKIYRDARRYRGQIYKEIGTQ